MSYDPATVTYGDGAVSYGDPAGGSLSPSEPTNASEPAQQPTTTTQLTYGQNDDQDVGEAFEFDSEFKGVDENRHCTDVCMLVFFILFFCGMLALFFAALTRSNYKYLYIPTDHRGMMCGYNNVKNYEIDPEWPSSVPKPNTTAYLLESHAADPDPPGLGNFVDLTDYPYLFWVRPGKKGYALSFCVKECPSKGLFSDTFQAMLSYPSGFNSNTTKCGESVNSTEATLENYSNPGHFYCPYASSDFAMRCFPTMEAIDNSTVESISQMSSNISAALESVSSAANAVHDLYLTYGWIALAVCISLVLSLGWLVLLRFIAPCMVWTTVILAIGALFFITFMAYKQRNIDFGRTNIQGYTLGLVNADMNKKTWTAIFIILIIVDVIFVLLIIFLFSRIKLSIGIIQTVSTVFGHVPQLFFFPIIIYLIEFAWWCYVIGVAIVLFGAGKPVNSYDVEYGIHKIVYRYDTLIQGFSIYHFIGFLWITWFIAALGQMTIAGVFADFYFATEPRKENMHKRPVSSSFFRSLRYHTGTLATGSLLITIMTLIRLAIEYIDKKTKESQSQFAKCCIKCMKCCFACLDKFLKYISKNAYIMTAIHGYSFFESCKKSFQLILRNCARAATLNFVGDFTLLLGRVFVSGTVTGIALILFKNCVDGITFPIVPAVIVFIVSLLASGAFTGVFEMGIDSMFLCFLEDTERNDGTPGHEQKAPEALKKFVTEK